MGMAMTMEHTLKTTRRCSSWPSMPAMLFSRFTALSLIQSTLLTFIRLQELLMTGKSLGMRFAFTTELRDTGHFGFELPKDQIIPSGEEMWAGFEVVIDRVQQTIAEEKAKNNL